MAKTDLKKAVIDTYNTTEKFISKISEVNRKVLYGKTQVPPVINFADPIERNKFTSNIKSFTQDPSLANATFIVQNLNSFDLCNPFMFILSQAFPPDSPVANTFNNIQGKINTIVSTFENYSIIDGVKQAKATARTSLDPVTTSALAFEGDGLISLPFQTGKIFLNIETTNTLNRGANITITQLNDDKIKSSMVGQIEEVVQVSNGTKTVSINVNNIFPSQTPTESNGETPKTFTNFSVEFETKTTSDFRKLGEDLQDLTNELRSIGIIDIIAELNSLPNSIPGSANLKEVFSNVNEILNDVQDTGAANITGTAGEFLTGTITPAEVIRRVRILRDFYAKIQPYTNLNFALQSFFEDEIEGINRFLRDAIPYEAISNLIRFIVNIARAVKGIIDFIIGLLKFISTALKVITIILKVLKVIVKVVKIVIKAIPSIATTVGVQEKAINGVGGIEDAIQQTIDVLKIIQWGVDSIIRQLQLTKFYLEIFIKEGAKLQATLESCNGIEGSGLDTLMNQANRNSFNALRSLLDSIPVLDSNTRFGSNNTSNSNGTGTNNNNTPGTFVITEGGTIILLTDTVFGFDEFGNIVFYGDLTSLSTGVNFENTLGQDFRSRLQYYTFNKFKNLDSAGNLIQKAEKLFLDKQTRIADPEDIFGNFQELYLGYTLKIQEEKRTNPNSQILIRRRGIALDSNGKIVASTELTFSTNLVSIVQELKVKLNQFVQQGIIGINTLDNQPNEVSDEDAINLAESYGANPIGINNLKANNADNSISNVSNGITNVNNSGISTVENTDDIETRIGNEPFSSPNTNNINTTVQGIPINTSNNSEMQVTGNNSSTVNKKIDLQKLTSVSLNQFLNENPSLKSLQDTFSVLSKVSPTQLSSILSQPGAENLNEEELITKLKTQILSELDPNPEKVDEIKRLTDQFLDALEGVVRAEWEAATRGIPLKFRTPFEVYYEQVEDDKIQEFVEGLLRKDYTETEVQLGVSKEEIGDKYSIRIEGTKVTVRLRSQK